MSINIRSQKGFGHIEVLLVLILISVIGFAGYYVYSQNKDTDNKDNAPVGQGNGADTKADPMTDWKTFIDSKDDVSFRYPSDWTVDIETFTGELGMNSGDGEYLSGTVTSPSGKIVLGYANFITGLGGGSCPDDFPCPFIDTLTIKDLRNLPTIQYVEKITFWKGNGDTYSPAFGLVGTESVPTVTGKKQENVSYMNTGISSSGSKFAYNPGSLAGDAGGGFKTEAAAKAFLNSKEAKIAKQILLSFEMQ